MQLQGFLGLGAVSVVDVLECDKNDFNFKNVSTNSNSCIHKASKIKKNREGFTH